MLHEKTVKESIKDIIKDIQCPDCTYPEAELDKAVNRIDLLIRTMLRNERFN